MISLISPSEVKNPTSIAIGSFDGLHAGHRKLIKSVVEDNLYTPTIASFWPHPREVLYKETRLRLDLPEEKLPILEDLGIEQLVLIPFDEELSKLSAESFVRDRPGAKPSCPSLLFTTFEKSKTAATTTPKMD